MADLELFRRPPRIAPALTLETVLTHPDYFGLVTASPLQRAICRILDGLPLEELAADPQVMAALAMADASGLPATRCAEFVLIAGIRSGKSLVAAACAVRAALTCDVSRLGPGDEVAVPIVSTKKKTARQTWSHVRGRVEASPKLRELIVGNVTAERLCLRHPSGTVIEITISAGSKAADTLVSRWLAGCIFDEAPRMVGADEGVVNLDDARHAVAGRMLRGAQVLLIGSPWAPFGPVYELVTEFHGKPNPNIVVVRATGPAMNPREWTPERCEELRARAPDAYRVDVLAEFQDPEAGLFALSTLEQAARKFPVTIDPVPGRYYSAAIDPATRGNAWTLVVVEHADGGKLRVVFHKQWIGSAAEPTSSKTVFEEMAKLLKPYGIGAVYTDQWAADPLKDVASLFGLWLISETVSGKRRLELYMGLRKHVSDKTLELPPDIQFLRDLSGVRRRVTQAGVTIDLPRTADGRHCDYAPALALAVGYAPRAPEEVAPTAGTDEAAKAQAAAEKEAARLEVERRNLRNSRNVLRRGYL